MAKIFECIPNISEGRDPAVVLECINAVKNTDGITLLNFTSDIDHNRSVITFIGNANAIEKAAINLCKKTTELIDLRLHKGEHPRVGALDVLPIVPLKDSTEDEAVELSKKIAKRIADGDVPPLLLGKISVLFRHMLQLMLDEV